MPATDRLLVAENRPVGSSSLPPPAPLALPVLSVSHATVLVVALLFFGLWWLTESRALHNPAIWLLLSAVGVLAAGNLFLTRVCRGQLRCIRQLKQAEKQLQAEVNEHARSFQLAQEAAEENRKTIWKVFKASPDPMAVLDGRPDGIFLAINQAFTTTFGYARDEVLGKTPVQMNLLVDPSNLAEFSRRLQPEGYVPDAETTFCTKEGKIVWGLLSAVTIEVAGNPFVNWIVRNITDRKRMEAELIAAREAAEAASRAKSEFLSSMSHEIRTPMNAVLGMAQLLAETALSDDQQHYLDLMVANGNALLELINSILDLAKIESGRMQVDQSDFDLTELVDRTVATFGVRAHSKGLELIARIAPGVPERLIGDPMRLRQIMTNLLGNAVKFTDRGEVVLEIEQYVLSDDAVELGISVADTGIGIPADKVTSIFQSFTQADSSTTRKYGGSGLGLSIVHRLVDLMGGQISVQSEPGRGSRFWFNARFSRASTPFIPRNGVNLAGYRLLIAGHSCTFRRVILEMLNDSGAEIDETAIGKNVLSSILQAAHEDRPYQLVLLDMGMPSLDGFEVAEHLLTHHLPLKSLLPMLSSDRLKQQVVRLQQLGLSTYLVKPITRKSLAASMATLVADAQTAIGPAAGFAPTHIRGARILVAEDSPDNRLVIAAYLRRHPFELDFAEDGKQAVAKFIGSPYDLVLMDIQMPEMDGLDAARAIRRWEAEHGRLPTPIVALTAYAFEEDVRRALSAGCSLHISKPLKKQMLIDCLEKALQPRATAVADHQAACISS